MKRRFAVLSVLMFFGVFLISVPSAQGAGKSVWKVPLDFPTIAAALASPLVMNGHSIFVGPGFFAGALVSKSVEVKGVGQAVINFGPLHGSGKVMGFRFLPGSDGATISNLTFDGVDFGIMNGGAVDDVTVDHCTFVNNIQAISNWRGSNWVITHNEITGLRSSNGGGIGILIGDFMGGVVEGNLVAHNKITGVLSVAANDDGGYCGSGIVLYADFRWGSLGTAEMKNNHVTKNMVAMSSDNPSLVDIVAFEMTDSRDDDSFAVIFDNAIGFNDFAGTALQIALTPLNLDAFNWISRNFGENRGHGLSPKLFR